MTILNAVALNGRITAEPELRYTPNNIAVLTFTIAVPRSYVKQGTERQTDFIDCTAWRQTAEFISKFFSKGSVIAIQGSLQTRNYTDKNGNKRKAVEVYVDNAHFVEGKSDKNIDAVNDDSDGFTEIDGSLPWDMQDEPF